MADLKKEITALGDIEVKDVDKDPARDKERLKENLVTRQHLEKCEQDVECSDEDIKKEIGVVRQMIIQAGDTNIPEAAILEALNIAAGNNAEKAMWLASQLGIDITKLQNTGNFGTDDLSEAGLEQKDKAAIIEGLKQLKQALQLTDLALVIDQLERGFPLNQDLQAILEDIYENQLGDDGFKTQAEKQTIFTDTIKGTILESIFKGKPTRPVNPDTEPEKVQDPEKANRQQNIDFVKSKWPFKAEVGNLDFSKLTDTDIRNMAEGLKDSTNPEAQAKIFEQAFPELKGKEVATTSVETNETVDVRKQVFYELFGKALGVEGTKEAIRGKLVDAIMSKEAYQAQYNAVQKLIKDPEFAKELSNKLGASEAQVKAGLEFGFDRLVSPDKFKPIEKKADAEADVDQLLNAMDELAKQPTRSPNMEIVPETEHLERAREIWREFQDDKEFLEGSLENGKISAEKLTAQLTAKLELAFGELQKFAKSLPKTDPDATATDPSQRVKDAMSNPLGGAITSVSNLGGISELFGKEDKASQTPTADRLMRALDLQGEFDTLVAGIQADPSKAKALIDALRAKIMPRIKDYATALAKEHETWDSVKEGIKQDLSKDKFKKIDELINTAFDKFPEHVGTPRWNRWIEGLKNGQFTKSFDKYIQEDEPIKGLEGLFILLRKFILMFKQLTGQLTGKDPLEKERGIANEDKEAVKDALRAAALDLSPDDYKELPEDVKKFLEENMPKFKKTNIKGLGPNPSGKDVYKFIKDLTPEDRKKLQEGVLDKQDQPNIKMALNKGLDWRTLDNLGNFQSEHIDLAVNGDAFEFKLKEGGEVLDDFGDWNSPEADKTLATKLQWAREFKPGEDGKVPDAEAIAKQQEVVEQRIALLGSHKDKFDASVLDNPISSIPESLVKDGQFVKSLSSLLNYMNKDNSHGKIDADDLKNFLKYCEDSGSLDGMTFREDEYSWYTWDNDVYMADGTKKSLSDKKFLHVDGTGYVWDDNFENVKAFFVHIAGGAKTVPGTEE